MDLELSQDQQDLRTLARDVLTARGGLQPARAFADGQGDADELFAEVARLGWYDVGLDDNDPFGLPGLCLLAEQLGAHATPNLLVDTAVARRLGVAEGVCSFALLGSDGHAQGVRHVEHADVVVCVERGSARVVDAAALGVTRVDGIDPSAATSEIVAQGAAGDPLDGDVRTALAIGATATAAEGIGAASRLLSLAVQYAVERHQFGRPIGANQALAHLMADAHVERETAWSTILYASGALHEGLDDALRAASIAKAHCARASRAVVEAALQVLGGVGFTWEHDAHLLQRRALDCERRYGDALEHERRLSEPGGR